MFLALRLALQLACVEQTASEEKDIYSLSLVGEKKEQLHHNIDLYTDLSLTELA